MWVRLRRFVLGPFDAAIHGRALLWSLGLFHACLGFIVIRTLRELVLGMVAEVIGLIVHHVYFRSAGAEINTALLDLGNPQHVLVLLVGRCMALFLVYMVARASRESFLLERTNKRLLAAQVSAQGHEIGLLQKILSFRQLAVGRVHVAPTYDWAYCSDAAKNVFGLEPEKLLGRNAFGFVHPGDRDKLSAELTEYLAVAKRDFVAQLELAESCDDGDDAFAVPATRPCHMTYRFLRDPPGTRDFVWVNKTFFAEFDPKTREPCMYHVLYANIHDSKERDRVARETHVG